MARQSKARVPAKPETAEPELLGHLPKEVGVLLIIAGIGGLLLPGPIGTPFLLAGGVALWPGVFTKLENRFQKRFPVIHEQGTRQIKRFVTDLQRRYPLPE
jgi:hypothetical protein